MKMLCRNITKILLKKHIIEESDFETCNMGLQLIISDIINFVIVILLGVLIGNPLYSLIYLATFCGVRKFSGGFHAETFLICRLSMIGIFLATVMLTHWFSGFSIWVSVFCVVCAVYTMIRFSPIIHPNRPLTTLEIKANKFVSILATSICSVISILLVMFEYKEGLYLSLVLFAITILMYIGRIVNSKTKTT